MHVIFLMLIGTAIAGVAAAENAGPSQNPVVDQSGGRTYLPAYQKHNEQQPQGPTGPLDTITGGAPAESPQGQSPPGMQAAPEGSSKSIIDNK
jgi:hypothetical protein